MITENYDLDIDSTLGGNNASDYIVPSQKAIKSYVDNNTGSTVDQVYDPASQAAQSGIAIAGANFLTSSDLTNYVTTNTDQDITGVKTFVGQKRIGFKQSSSSDKLGFTCFNNSSTELGAFEYRPNTISGKALLNVNCPYTGDYVGFRYWGTAVNVVAPKVATAGTYYIPTHITDGNTTVTANNTGTVNISTLLPTSDIFIAQYGITSYTDITTAINDGKLVLCTYNGNTYYYIGSGNNEVSFVTNTVGTNYIITVDSSNNWTNDSRAFPTALSDLTVSAGNNITISGNTISATDTTYSDFTGADSITAGASGLVPAPSAGDDDKILTGGGSWESVTTALGYTPVNKSGDTMTGNLHILKDAPAIVMQNNNANADYTSTTAPSNNILFLDLPCRDKNNKTTGGLTMRHDTNNNFLTLLFARRSINGSEKSAYFDLYVDSSGNPHCKFPQTTCCDGQWVSYSQSIISSSTSLYNSGGSALGYRIALPNDGHNYEVLVTGRCITSSTTGHFVVMACNGNGDGATFTSYICGCRTRASNNVDAWGTTIVVCKYVASGSNNFWLARTTNSNGDGNCEELKVVAYRRIGTNS